MLGLVSVLVFAGAAGLAIGVIALAIGPRWRRIARLAAGHVEQGFAPLPTADRWRAVHLDADRRRPFHAIRGPSSRRGLLDRLVGR
jgi:hypothetical protein